MKQYNKITPEGTKDRLFGECEKRGGFVRSLRALFESRGFREVSTPVLEYYDVFGTARAYFPQEGIYKLVDHDGRILVLRPDCTIPIARLIGARLKNERGPLRIFYHQKIYRHASGHTGLSGEIAQMGVEFVGGDLPICDVEIVELACRSLRSVCGSDYQLELCHIGYLNALVDSLDTDPATREQIRELVEHKNFPALDLLLERFEGCPAQKALKKLPALFGSVSVLEEARALFSNEAADRALDALADLYNALSSLGLDHLSLDLGLVNQADYYTGIIFRGYTAGAGEPVLAGGRYDELIGEFGAPPALDEADGLQGKGDGHRRVDIAHIKHQRPGNHRAVAHADDEVRPDVHHDNAEDQPDDVRRKEQKHLAELRQELELRGHADMQIL